MYDECLLRNCTRSTRDISKRFRPLNEILVKILPTFLHTLL